MSTNKPQPVAAIVDWNDVNEPKRGDGAFMNLQEGSNIVRVLAPPARFFVHYIPNNVDGSVKRIKSTLTPNCPLAAKAQQAGSEKQQKMWKCKERYYLRVLERNTNSFKIVEVPQTVAHEIRGLNNHSYWGDPRGYDIDIQKLPRGSMPMYKVMALQKSPLDESVWNNAQEFLNKKTKDGSKLLIEALIEPISTEEALKELNTPKGNREDNSNQNNSFNQQSSTAFQQAPAQPQQAAQAPQVTNTFAPPPGLVSPQPSNNPQFTQVAQAPVNTVSAPQFAPPPAPPAPPAQPTAPQFAPPPAPPAPPAQETVVPPPETQNTNAQPPLTQPAPEQNNTPVDDPSGVSSELLKHT